MESNKRDKSLTRLGVQEVLQSVSVNERTTYCGRRPSAGTVSPALVVRSSGAHSFVGFQTCGSVWSCPVCSSVASAERRSEVDDLVSRWRNAQTDGENNDVLMVTFTLSHNKSHSLKELLSSLTSAYGVLNQGRNKEVLNTYGVVGSVRGLEVKWSEKSGWHPHLHVLYFVKGRTTETSREDFKKSLFRLYSSRLKKMGSSATFEHGIDVRVAVSSEYVAKMDDGVGSGKVSFEVASSVTKINGGESVTPFQLGLAAAKTGEVVLLAAYREYEKTMKGQRALFVSSGLHKLVSSLPLPVVSSEEVEEVEEDTALYLVGLPVEVVKYFAVRGFRAFLLSQRFELCNSYEECSDLIMSSLHYFKNNLVDE